MDDQYVFDDEIQFVAALNNAPFRYINQAGTVWARRTDDERACVFDEAPFGTKNLIPIPLSSRQQIRHFARQHGFIG